MTMIEAKAKAEKEAEVAKEAWTDDVEERESTKRCMRPWAWAAVAITAMILIAAAVYFSADK